MHAYIYISRFLGHTLEIFLRVMRFNSANSLGIVQKFVYKLKAFHLSGKMALQVKRGRRSPSPFSLVLHYASPHFIFILNILM